LWFYSPLVLFTANPGGSARDRLKLDWTAPDAGVWGSKLGSVL